MIKHAMVAIAVFGLAVSAAAQPMRTLLVRENRLPDPGDFEVGLIGSYEDIDYTFHGFTLFSAEIIAFEPYARYGLTPNTSLQLTVPMLQVNPEWGSSESGVGDVRLGGELRIYEDIFGHPWVIPYAEVSFPTGSESKGLGAGDMGLDIGVATGALMYDYLSVILDVGYEIIRDSDNRFSVGGGLVWDVSRKFSMVGELRWYEGVNGGGDAMRYLGGMIYRPLPNWMVGLYGGVHSNDEESTMGMVKVSYLLP